MLMHKTRKKGILPVSVGQFHDLTGMSFPVYHRVFLEEFFLFGTCPYLSIAESL